MIKIENFTRGIATAPRYMMCPSCFLMNIDRTKRSSFGIVNGLVICKKCHRKL